MLKDYHMHPMIVQNPDRFDDFARRAISKGIQEVCITDHMPLSISDAQDRIPAGKVREYCEKVRETADRYEGILSVKLGIEIDYHPDFTDEIEDVLGAGDFDFVLGSSHMHVFTRDFFDGSLGKNDFARMALENTLLAVKSNYFHAITHLDMFRWVFSQPNRFPLKNDDYDFESHKKLIDEILDVMRDKGIFLEINPHFAEAQNRLECTYPEAAIVEMALERDLPFCYGSDAHSPQSVGALLELLRAHPTYAKALKIWETTAQR